MAILPTLRPSSFSSSLSLSSIAVIPNRRRKFISSSAPPQLRSGVSFSIGTHLIPHPNKVDRGGEDAFFVSSFNGGVIVVAGLGVGEVIQFYDSDRRFPSWGFGGKKPDGSVSHCFDLIPSCSEHMSKQRMPGLPAELMKKGEHFILIRNPLNILPSFDKVVPPSFLELGSAELVTIYQELCELGKRPPVIDADELQEDPEGTLRHFCEDLGIPFQDKMLKWDVGPKPIDGIWAPWWYENVHKSTGEEILGPVMVVVSCLSCTLHTGDALTEVAVVPEDVGTADALRAIIHHLTAHDILVVSGDLVFDVPPGAVAAAHRRHDALITAMLLFTTVTVDELVTSAGLKIMLD